MISVAKLSDRKSELAAGRLWQRLHLRGTTLELATQPLNQLSEIIDRQHRLGAASAISQQVPALIGQSRHPVLAFRPGYPTRQATA